MNAELKPTKLTQKDTQTVNKICMQFRTFWSFQVAESRISVKTENWNPMVCKHLHARERKGITTYVKPNTEEVIEPVSVLI